MARPKEDPKKLAWEVALGGRLREAREASKMTMPEVAKHMGRVKQLVFQWERATSQCSAYDIVALSKLYGADLLWLLSGQRVTTKSPSGIAKATITQISDFAESLKEKSNIPTRWATGHIWLPQTQGLTPKAIAFTAIDRSMTPTIDIGDVVVVDEDEGVSGDVGLFVLRDTAEVLLRRCEWKGTSLAPPYILTADNKRIAPRHVTKEDDPVNLGWFIEATRYAKARASQPPTFSTAVPT